MKKPTILLCAIAIAMGAYAAPDAAQTTADEGWSEWEPFAPLGLSTGTYTTFVDAPFIQTTIPVEVRTNLIDPTHKQIRMNEWGKIVYDYTQEVIVDWFTGNDSCFFHATTMHRTTAEGELEVLFEDAAAWGQVSESRYDPATATFSFHLFADLGNYIKGPSIETLEMNHVYTERDTVDVNLNNVAIYGIGYDLGVFHYKALDNEQEMFIDMYLLGYDLTGTFSVLNTTLDISTTVNSINTKDGEVSVTQNDSLIIVTGWIIGQDEVYYRLHLTSKTGGLAGDEQERDINSISRWADIRWDIEEDRIAYIEGAGKSSLGATNLQLVLFVSDTATMIPAGVYPISDTQEEGTALKSIGMSDGEDMPCSIHVPDITCYSNWYMQEGNVTISYDQYGKMSVLVEAKNSYGKNIHIVAKYEKIEPKDTVEIVADNFVAEYMSAGNYYSFKAANQNYATIIYVTPVSFRTPAGEYKDHAIYMADNSRITIKKETSFDYVWFLDCEITVTLDGTDLALVGWALGKDSVLYNLNFTGTVKGMERETNRNYTGTFDLDKAVLAMPEDYTVSLSVTNDNREQLVLYFLSARITRAEIPTDRYDIDSVFSPMYHGDHIVLPSKGIQDGEITYSYVATLNEQGEPEDIWYIEAGQVVVADDGTITVDAINSLYKTIHITVTKQGTGLIDLNANSEFLIQNSKFIKNGQLYIRKGNKTYNVVGKSVNW